MTNTSAILNEYITSNVLPEYEIIYNDVFPDNEAEALISRYDPSAANETEFIDGTATGAQSLAYYIRSKNAATCRENLTALIDAVDGLKCTSDGIEINFEVTTLPQFVSIDEKNNTVYTAEIIARYIRKGE